MSDKLRAKKLAAAKKKLREYQSKEKHPDFDGSDTSECGSNSSKKQFQSIISASVNHEHSQDINKSYETFENDHREQQYQHNTTNNNNNTATVDNFKDFFKSTSEDEPVINVISKSNDMETISNLHNYASLPVLPKLDIDDKSHIETMEILISEKTALTSELTKQKTLCKEKILENEELTMQVQILTNRNNSMENEIHELLAQNGKLKTEFETAKIQFTEQKNEYEKQNKKLQEVIEHLEEIKKELIEEQKKTEKLEQDLKEKSCELELSLIRINQISDEASLATDNRVEILTQTKFMYEQQIRDLQAMVQQLTTERDQSNQQYQNYVQHLNKEMSSINEKNSELITENERLINHERQLIDHIANLEKQIQENIAKQENMKEKSNNLIESTLENESLQELKNEYEILKQKNINLQNTNELLQEKLEKITENINEKDLIIKELNEKINLILSDQPNNEKLLATIESDKIAASRAVSQNEELKKQLDEVQQKLIQITNDKVDLVQQLDSEQYKNRLIRENYEIMEKQLEETKEKLHFKDEEMIRLIHEQNELNKTILQLNQKIDRLMHYEAKEYQRQLEIVENINNLEKNELNENDKINEIKNEENHDIEQNHNHHSHENNCHSHEDHENQEILETNVVTKAVPENSSHLDDEDCNKQKHSTHINCESALPKHEAMEKLQERFKKLISENADLTDEKQRLEHLVCQLQNETETIGEYITLYQTQRRMLKQREIEKSTQLHMLLTEREEMKEKIINLTQLVENLVKKYTTNNTNNQNEIFQNANSILPYKKDNYNLQRQQQQQSNENINISLDNNVIKFNQNTEGTTLKNSNLLTTPSTSLTLENTSDVVSLEKQRKQHVISDDDSNPILLEIRNIINEIKERETQLQTNLKFVNSVDHCACCSGKFETI